MSRYKLLSSLINWMFPTKEHRQAFRQFCNQIDNEINTENNYKKTLRRIREKYKKGEKLRVLFLIRENSKWTYDSLYREMKASELFEPVIGVSLLTSVVKGEDRTRNNLDLNYNFFKNQGYEVVKLYEEETKKYIGLEQFRPDFVFYDQTWELPFKHSPVKVSKFALTGYCHYSYQVVDYEKHYTQNFHKLLWKYFAQHQASIDRFGIYNKKECTNCCVTGYPKLDVFLENGEINTSEIWKEPEKLKIIYAPHHSFEDDSLKMATFKENGRLILDLAKTHPETTWVFKPHPRFKFALLKNNIMTESEIEEYYTEWEKIGKIYDKGNYFDIFKSSDLMITDCGSFIAEYLPTHNPVIRMVNKESIGFNLIGNKIIDTYYNTYSNDELVSVFNKLVVEKDDYIKTKREELIPEIIDFREKSSQKIINYIKKELENG